MFNSHDKGLGASAATLAPLRNPVFRAVWLASLVSNFGSLIQSVGASWMMVTIGRSAEMIALVQASVTLPIMLLSLLGGAVADSFDRRRVMIAAQCFMLIVSVALSTCAWLGVITPWLLLLFTFLIGCGTAFYNPAWKAAVGDMVPRTEISGAVSLNSMGFNIARTVGPAVGGAIVATLGAAAAFALNAVSYIGLVLVLQRWRPPAGEAVLPRERVGEAIMAGIRYAAMSPALGLVLSRSLVFGLGACAVPSLMPLIARDIVGGGALTYGLLLGAFGVGAVAGAFLSEQLRRMLSSEGIVRASTLTFALTSVFGGISSFLAITMLVLVAGGAAWMLALSTFNVTVQLQSPRWVVARALSLYQMAVFGGMAAGSWMWGIVAEEQGAAIALAAAASIQLLCLLMGFRLPLPNAEELDLTPLRQWQAPDMAIPVDGRSGPVVIMIEYQIAPSNLTEFLDAMAERRRIRRRDGARHWTLLRDLSQPQILLERFELPTWLDYIRHNSRMTREDAPAHDRVRALHIGSKPPLVRRMIAPDTGVPAANGPDAQELAEPLTDASRSA